ncbi:MAG: LysM peptidoglycan-binding domain-containing protein [Opitutaceae bacterium]|jgi:tetratricopeptide (TPR) repeat protein|nr:LysM peptidoglycan-binding domain-containing protein [Opitutaceae bacterium]
MTKRTRLCLFLLCAAVALPLQQGCDRGRDTLTTLEEDDPDFQRGRDMLRQGESRKALAAFLTVIQRRGDKAPEAHLDAGILYQEHSKDPVAAIYHYRKFRELRPNAPQADLVLQRIEAAQREFARTLPLQPADGQFQRADLLATIGQLKRENALLASQLEAARAAAPAQQAPSLLATVAATAPRSTAPAAEAAARERTVPGGAGAAGTPGRVHVVAKGDTLSSIAQKYYGNRTRYREIYDANRDILPNDHDLKIGMELRVP